MVCFPPAFNSGAGGSVKSLRVQERGPGISQTQLDLWESKGTNNLENNLEKINLQITLRGKKKVEFRSSQPRLRKGK